MDPGSVGKPGIHDRIAFIYDPVGRPHNLLDRPDNLPVIHESILRTQDLPIFLDKDLVRANHHDLADRIILQIRLKDIQSSYGIK